MILQIRLEHTWVSTFLLLIHIKITARWSEEKFFELDVVLVFFTIWVDAVHIPIATALTLSFFTNNPHWIPFGILPLFFLHFDWQRSVARLSFRALI